MSAPNAAASWRALRNRSRFPAMSPTIEGICASAMTRRLAGEDMTPLLPEGHGRRNRGRRHREEAEGRRGDPERPPQPFTLDRDAASRLAMATVRRRDAVSLSAPGR